MPHGPPLSLHIRCNTKGTITPCIFQAVFLVVFFHPPEKFSLISSDNENKKKIQPPLRVICDVVH